MGGGATIRNRLSHRAHDVPDGFRCREGARGIGGRDAKIHPVDIAPTPGHDPGMHHDLTAPEYQPAHAASRLVIPSDVLGTMINHATSELPNESVGLLTTIPADGGPGERVTAYLAGRNLDASPMRYTMHPADVRTALAMVGRTRSRLGGIVHSHPRDPAIPSATDLAEARLPHALMVIVSLAASSPIVRAWRLRTGTDGGTAAIEVRIDAAGPPVGMDRHVAAIEEMRR